MKRPPALLLLLLLLFCLAGQTGCWDQAELENLGLILTMGLDSLPGRRVEVTVQVAVPTLLAPSGEGGPSSGEELPTQVVTETGRTVLDALRAIDRTVNRRLSLAQNQVIIFGADTARQGIGRYLDLLTRNREFRRTMQIMVAEGRAKEVMTLKPKLELNPAEYLLDLIDLARYTGESDLIDLNEFALRLAEPGASPYAPYLKQDKGQEGGGGKKPGSGKITIGGLAVFNRDRLVGIYDPQETIYHLMLNGRLLETTLAIPDPFFHQRTLAIRLYGANPRIDPSVEGGRLRAAVHLRVEGDLIAAESNRDYTTLAEERRLEAAVARYLQKRLRAVVLRAQEAFQADSFNLGQYFRPLFPDWRSWIDLDWPERFPQVPIEIRVDFELRRFGLLQWVQPIVE